MEQIWASVREEAEDGGERDRDGERGERETDRWDDREREELREKEGVCVCVFV